MGNVTLGPSFSAGGCARARPVRDAQLLGLLARGRLVEPRAPDVRAGSAHRIPSRQLRPGHEAAPARSSSSSIGRILRGDRQQAVLDLVGQAELLQEQPERRPERDLRQVDGHGGGHGLLRLLEADGIDVDRDAVGERRALGAGPDILDDILERGLVRERHVDRLSPVRRRSAATGRRGASIGPGVDGAGDGHLEREQLGRRGIQRRPGGRERDADVRARTRRSAGPRRRDTRAGRAGGLGGAAAEAILRPPVRGADQVAEPHRARRRPGLVHDDHGIAFDAARAGGQLGELPPGELGRLGVGLQLPAEVGLVFVLAPRFSMTNLLRVRMASLSSRPFSVRPVRAVPVKPSSFWRYWRSSAWTAISLLEPLGLGLELLEQLLLGPDLLARVLLDGRGSGTGC